MWLGLGSNSEQLRVNRRDGAVWYEYSETGTISGKRFYKFRWRGYSYYSSTSDAYLEQFDVYLFDDGRIYLDFFQVPTQLCDGTKQLICGNETVSYSVSTGVACEYTFTPSNPQNGTGWSVTSGQPAFPKYVSSGNAIVTVSMQEIDSYSSAVLSWIEDTPAGTTISVDTKLNNESVWNPLPSTRIVSGITKRTDCSSLYLDIRISMTTTDENVSPSLEKLMVFAYNTYDANKIVLNFPKGINQSFQRAEGRSITVNYDGHGSLRGWGGPVQAFSESFTPTELTNPKNNPNGQEHIELSKIGISISNILLRHVTVDAPNEHVEIDADITTVLTDIHDI